MSIIFLCRIIVAILLVITCILSIKKENPIYKIIYLVVLILCWILILTNTR